MKRIFSKIIALIIIILGILMLSIGSYSLFLHYTPDSDVSETNSDGAIPNPNNTSLPSNELGSSLLVPDYFPDYPDANVSSEFKVTGNYSSKLSTYDSPETVLEYYRTRLPEYGWNILSDTVKDLSELNAILNGSDDEFLIYTIEAIRGDQRLTLKIEGGAFNESGNKIKPETGANIDVKIIKQDLSNLPLNAPGYPNVSIVTEHIQGVRQSIYRGKVSEPNENASFNFPENLEISAYSNDSYEQIISFYREKVPENGWTINGETEEKGLFGVDNGERTFTMYAEKGEFELLVFIADPGIEALPQMPGDPDSYEKIGGVLLGLNIEKGKNIYENSTK